jgi:EAL domain-containing protein (putative c-di-GMP-specific phosphodiesterase class I)/GGDEF domain-containing protein
MEQRITPLRRAGHRIAAALTRLDVLAIFPLVALTAHWLNLGDLVTVTAFALPALLAVSSLAGRGAVASRQGGWCGAEAPPAATGPEALRAMLDRVAQRPDQDSACLLVQIDGWDELVGRLGLEAAAGVSRRIEDRLETALRHDDLLVRLGESRFGVVLHPQPAARLATREAIAARLSAAVGEALFCAGGTLHLSACIGHTRLIRAGGNVAAATLAGAEAALSDAAGRAPGTIRGFSVDAARVRADIAALAREVEDALAAGEIQAWFQPQVCAINGALSGVEALARWHHPTRGMLAPGAFLPAVAAAGQMEALGASILSQALQALHAWDAQGLGVPGVSVNVCAAELRNPHLAEKIRWDLDRFDLRPCRLTVEILETVAAKPEDAAITATLRALRRQGVNLDLDDFGIGQASLSAIHRFGVSRIKIDRSFVQGMDTDPEQAAMIAAILSMAVHLGVDTLAEGVETEEIALRLADMGCRHLQGFHFARPMPAADVPAWIAARSGTARGPAPAPVARHRA